MKNIALILALIISVLSSAQTTIVEGKCEKGKRIKYQLLDNSNQLIIT